MPSRKSPPGPVPTLAQLGHDTDWVWAHCTLPCNHSAAIPLAPIIARLGANASSGRLRSSLRCNVCGKLGVEIMLPSWIDLQRGRAKLPRELVPVALRRAIARDALARIGVMM